MFALFFKLSVIRRAKILNVHPMYVLKTLALNVGNSKIFFVSDGDSKVDFDEIAAKLNFEKVVLDKPAQYESIFPFKEMENSKVYFNESILSLYGEVYVESGYNNLIMLKYKVEDFLSLIPKESILNIKKIETNDYNFSTMKLSSIQTVKFHFV
jgi:prolyl-tRNA editing enzyme YbaK/EbsC (Cys-tRNA(Pro) deacylase)